VPFFPLNCFFEKPLPLLSLSPSLTWIHSRIIWQSKGSRKAIWDMVMEQIAPEYDLSFIVQRMPEGAAMAFLFVLWPWLKQRLKGGESQESKQGLTSERALNELESSVFLSVRRSEVKGIMMALGQPERAKTRGWPYSSPPFSRCAHANGPFPGLTLVPRSAFRRILALTLSFPRKMRKFPSSSQPTSKRGHFFHASTLLFPANPLTFAGGEGRREDDPDGQSPPAKRRGEKRSPPRST